MRRVKSSGVEVIRSIYGAVRDKNWDTVEPRLKIERLESDDDSFCLEFSAQHEDEPVCFSWKGTIQGQGGSLEFRFDGRAENAFLRNRIGLCTLHPIAECAGKPAGSGIRTACGKTESSRFSFPPISRSKISERFPGIRQIVSMPVFNLKATSSKWRTSEIGQTPHIRPIAHLLSCLFRSNLPPTKRFTSALFLRWSQRTQEISTTSRHSVNVAVSPASEARQVPKIGLGAAGHGSPLSSWQQDRLARLRLNHLRVDIHFSRSSWRTVLRRAQDEALAINARLQCALFLNDSAEENLSDFVEAIKPDSVDVCLVFHEAEKSTTARWFELAERHLIPKGLRVATGTNAYFAELNRQRPPRGATACYSINPQVHTFDDLSLVETLEAQPVTVESALQFCDRDLIVSPITLRPRFNPNATDPAKQSEDLSSAADPRQSTLFCAAWTVGSLARLLPLDRVESLTFYETSGPRGVMTSDPDSADPKADGKIFPVYYVFEAMAGIRNLLPVSISDQTLVTAFAFRNEQGQSIGLIANLTNDPKDVELEVPASALNVLSHR